MPEDLSNEAKPARMPDLLRTYHPLIRGVFMKAIRQMLVACLAIIAVSMPSLAQATKGYKVVDKVKIGGEGGWDYLIADAAAKRLYLSHGTVVVVFDTKTNKVVG
jgi:hypothetical protein